MILKGNLKKTLAFSAVLMLGASFVHMASAGNYAKKGEVPRSLQAKYKPESVGAMADGSGKLKSEIKDVAQTKIEGAAKSNVPRSLQAKYKPQTVTPQGTFQNAVQSEEEKQAIAEALSKRAARKAASERATLKRIAAHEKGDAVGEDPMIKHEKTMPAKESMKKKPHVESAVHKGSHEKGMYHSGMHHTGAHHTAMHGGMHGGDHSMTLHETIHQATNTNPEILAFRAAQDSIQFRIDQARGGYFPVIDFRGGAGYEWTNQKFGVNQLNRGSVSGTVSTDRYDPSLSLRQMVFDGFETINQVKKAEKEHTQSKKKTIETKELVGFNAADSFVSVRRFERLERLAQQNIKIHKAILGKVNSLVRAGKETADARHNVEARLRDAEAAWRDIQSDLNTAIARYIELVGTKPGRLGSAEVPSRLLPTSEGEAIKIALSENKSLDLARSGVDVAKADAKVSEAPFWPRLDLEVDGRRTWNADSKTGTENNVTALAVVRYNLFNGGKDMAFKRELRAKITEAKYQMMTQKRTAEKEVRVSWAEMQSAKQQSIALRKAVKAKQRVRDTYMAQFDTGKRSFVDILDASHEYFLAKGSLITTDALYDIASVRLLASMGVLVSRLEHIES